MAQSGSIPPVWFHTLSLRALLQMSPYMNIDTQAPAIIHVSHIVEVRRFCALPPSMLFFASIMNQLKVASLL